MREVRTNTEMKAETIWRKKEWGVSQNRRKAKTWTKNEEKKKRERSCSSWVCE